MSAKLWKNSVCVAFFLIPTLGKSELTIMKEDPDSASKNLVLCSINFTADSFINKAQFDEGCLKRLKLNDDTVPTIFYLTVMLQV